MMPSSLTTWPPESNFVLTQWIAIQMKAQTEPFKMRAGLSSKNVDEFLSAAPSMQPQCLVERARVRHLARHPEVNLNLLTMVDILNKSPNQALHYLSAHLYLEWANHRATRVGRSTPASTNVHIGITLKSREWLERKLNLITKMSTSNYSTITSLHDSHLHLWQSWQICCEHWLSPKFLPTGHWGRRKISTRLKQCDPK